jgi:hypothetical protein
MLHLHHVSWYVHRHGHITNDKCPSKVNGLGANTLKETCNQRMGKFEPNPKHCEIFYKRLLKHGTTCVISHVLAPRPKYDKM